MPNNENYVSLPEITVTPQGNSFSNEYPNMLPEITVTPQQQRTSVGSPFSGQLSLSALANREGMLPGRFRLPRGYLYNYTIPLSAKDSANRYQKLIDDTNANSEYKGYKDWMSNWYANRLGIGGFDNNDLTWLNKTLQNTGIVDTDASWRAARVMRDAGHWNAIQQNNPRWVRFGDIVATDAYRNIRDNSVGGFSTFRGGMPIVLKSTLPGYRWTSPIHELTHTTEGIGQSQNVKDIVGEQPGYYGRPEEIYARMNELRYGAGLDPNKSYNYRQLRRAARKSGLTDVFNQIRSGVYDAGKSARRKITSLFRDVAYAPQTNNTTPDTYLA